MASGHRAQNSAKPSRAPSPISRAIRPRDPSRRLVLPRDNAMLNSSRNVALACALSALAGYVDGIGFIHLGGQFVSFMSGNSTRMGVSLADGHWHDAAQAF